MKRNHAHSEDEYRPRDIGTDGLDMFAPQPPAWTTTPATQSKEDRAAERHRLQERLEPIAVDLAARRGPEGITASELQAEAIVLGILTPLPKGEVRRYSWIGPWLLSMARRGKLKTKVLRLEGGDTIPATRVAIRNVSHGNGNLIFLHPQVAA